MDSKSKDKRDRRYFIRAFFAGCILASLASSVALVCYSPITPLQLSAPLSSWSSTTAAAAALNALKTSAWMVWGFAQICRSLTPEAFGVSNALEENVYRRADKLIWSLWEGSDEETHAYYYNYYESSSNNGDDASSSSSKKKQAMEMEVITVDLLMREGFTPDLTRPFRISGFMPEDHLKMVDLIREKPYGDLIIDYFTDARQVNTVPDGRAPLREIVANISRGNSYAKFGSEMLFREHPELLHHLPLDRVKKVTGDGYIDTSLIGDFLTIPVFMAHGHEGNGAERREPRATPRTDLHCEPIANVVIQVTGSKLWTLYPPQSSRSLRPKISPDGRAYIFSARDPGDEDLQTIERYSVVLEEGDAMFLPSWTWHRVDYLPGVTALSVSFFHVRIKDMFTNNPIFALVTFPNMLKEFFGVKMQ